MEKITLNFTKEELQIIETALFGHKIALKHSSEISMAEAMSDIHVIEQQLLPRLEAYVQ